MRFSCLILLGLAGCSALTGGTEAAIHPVGENAHLWVGKHALDLRTGSVLWEVHTKEKWEGVVSEAAGSDVFLETQERKLHRRRLVDGRILWEVAAFDSEEYKVDQYLDWPTIAVTEHVVLHACQKRLKAHDRESGKLLWSQALEPGGSRKLLVSQDQFFVPGVPALFDLRSGRTVWKSTEDVEEASYLPGGDLMVALYDGIGCLSRQDGHVLWKAKMTKEPGAAFFSGRYMVVGSKADDDNAWAAVWDGVSGRQLWFAAGKHPVAAAVSEDGESFYVGRWDHRNQGDVDLIALDTRTWSTRWEKPGELDGMVLLPAGPRLFVAEYVPVSFDTRFYCLSTRDGSTLWNGELEGIAVPHSIYGQGAEVQLRGPWVVLIDSQSAGSFVQAFEVKTGRQVSKWRYLNQ